MRSKIPALRRESMLGSGLRFGFGRMVRQFLPPAPFRELAIRACLLVFLCAGFPARAQYRSDVWTADNGLPQNIVRGIYQAPDGFLWIATFDGLVRFDGIRFSVFNKSNAPGMDSNRIVSMYGEPHGDLWLNSEGGGLTRYHDGVFQTFGAAQGVPEKTVRGITGDDTGRVWFLTSDTIAEWDRARERFADVTPSAPRLKYESLRWANQGFWGWDERGIHCFIKGRFFHYLSHNESPVPQARLEERLEERERIARDLHDTLLQGFVSAYMQLDVANDRLAADPPAKPLVQHVLDLMKQVSEEGRSAIRSLRSPHPASDGLEDRLSGIREEFPLQEQVEFRVIVEGTPSALFPFIREEVYRIAREAVINAFRHSGASSIEVEIKYAARSLRIIVRDNGCGVDSEMLQTGREGHWGLSNMRERAEKIGARFAVLSRAGAGTEVDLSVPGKVAFETTSSEGWWKRLTRWFPGQTGC